MSLQPLVCPSCGRGHPGSERFCEECGMPLVHAEGAEIQDSERRRRARKIKPQYTEGELVRVARAANLVQAEFIAGMLLEEGIPSIVRRSDGFEVPYAPLTGPREVFVPESAAQAAREALAWEARG
jgi:hypothetical protein